MKLTADLSNETCRPECLQDILKVMRMKKTYNQDYLSSKDLIQIQKEIKRFTEKQKLRELNTTKPPLQQILKEIL